MTLFSFGNPKNQNNIQPGKILFPGFSVLCLLAILFTLGQLFFISCSSGKAKESTGNTPAPVLVIHGGAGTITRERMTDTLAAEIRKVMQKALEEGYLILQEGGSSVEAVVTAIQVMEESPLFNAGKGAVFTWEEKNELDASIMEGAHGNAGAVAGVSTIRSPIEAAMHVMTNSPHVLLTGKGAEEFAEKEGLEMADPAYFYTEDRYRQLMRIKAASVENKEESKGSSYVPGNQTEFKFGTVGAVALDKRGNLAAGTSTGGTTNKRYGRIGDSPIIGAGTYADNKSCAVSATGHGEYFIRNVVAYDIAARMKYQGKDLSTASEEVIRELKLKDGSGGVICLDAQGNIAMPFNTEGMYRGYIDQSGETVIEFYGEEAQNSSQTGKD